MRLKFLEILEKCWFFEEKFKPFCLIIKKFEKLDLPTLGLISQNKAYKFKHFSIPYQVRKDKIKKHARELHCLKSSPKYYNLEKRLNR